MVVTCCVLLSSGLCAVALRLPELNFSISAGCSVRLHCVIYCLYFFLSLLFFVRSLCVFRYFVPYLVLPVVLCIIHSFSEDARNTGADGVYASSMMMTVMQDGDDDDDDDDDDGDEEEYNAD